MLHPRQLKFEMEKNTGPAWIKTSNTGKKRKLTQLFQFPNPATDLVTKPPKSHGRYCHSFSCKSKTLGNRCVLLEDIRSMYRACCHNDQATT